MQSTVVSPLKKNSKPLKSRLLSLLGRLISKFTNDPVLANFVEVVGATVPASTLFTILAWRLAMSLGNFLARFALFRRWAYTRLQLFHRLNQRFDKAALALAMSPLRGHEERLQWCRILGIDPDRDLENNIDSYKTVNDLFTHAPGKDTRPIADPGNQDLMIAPCDGSYASFAETQKLRSFISKQSHFEIEAVLGDDAAPWLQSFAGGAASFIWLSAVDNHCWYAPSDGTILHAKRIEASTHGRLGLFLEDGYCAANTRGVVIIERDDRTRLAFVAIGLTPINTINVKVKDGQRIQKGELLGCFEVGGSAALVFFDRNLNVDFGEKKGNFKDAEAMLNLNYMQEHNKSRLIIGESLALVRNLVDRNS